MLCFIHVAILGVAVAVAAPAPAAREREGKEKRARSVHLSMAALCYACNRHFHIADMDGQKFNTSKSGMEYRSDER